MKRIPGYDQIVQSFGGCPKDPVRPEVLESFVDANLDDLNSASMTAILNYCGEAGATLWPLAQRISDHAEKSGIKHFVFDLSFLRVLSTNLKERPELDGEFGRRFDEFLKQNHLCSFHFQKKKFSVWEDTNLDESLGRKTFGNASDL